MYNFSSLGWRTRANARTHSLTHSRAPHTRTRHTHKRARSESGAKTFSRTHIGGDDDDDVDDGRALWLLLLFGVAADGCNARARTGATGKQPVSASHTAHNRAARTQLSQARLRSMTTATRLPTRSQTHNENMNRACYRARAHVVPANGGTAESARSMHTMCTLCRHNFCNNKKKNVHLEPGFRHPFDAQEAHRSAQNRDAVQDCTESANSAAIFLRSFNPAA